MFLFNLYWKDHKILIWENWNKNSIKNKSALLCCSMESSEPCVSFESPFQTRIYIFELTFNILQQKKEKIASLFLWEGLVFTDCLLLKSEVILFLEAISANHTVKGVCIHLLTHRMYKWREMCIKTLLISWDLQSHYLSPHGLFLCSS